jgi:pyroglutamyl-peptidase
MRMSAQPILVTGFEPYGGRGSNPAYEVMKALHGRVFDGTTVVGGGLPVSLTGMKNALHALLDEVRPSAVISLGLWPGEPMIRLERVGVNVADFEIADNEGVLLRDAPVSESVSTAHWSTLPLRAIETALLKEGVPVRISSTAGTFLCNACLYTLMEALSARKSSIPAGFIHLPYMPEQVATLLRDLRSGEVLELHQRADVASMELSRTVRAVEIAISITVKTLARSE